MDSKQKKIVYKRLVLAILLIAGIFFVLAARLFYVQVIKSAGIIPTGKKHI
jgi:cell division protein FtsI/penicillin-binding protein 2